MKNPISNYILSTLAGSAFNFNILGAVLGVAGAIIGGRAQKKAARAQAATANAQIAAEREMFEKNLRAQERAYKYQRGKWEDYSEPAYQRWGDYLRMDPSQRMATIESLPGFKAEDDFMQRTIMAQQAARGRLQSGRGFYDAMQGALQHYRSFEDRYLQQQEGLAESLQIPGAPSIVSGTTTGYSNLGQAQANYGAASGKMWSSIGSSLGTLASQIPWGSGGGGGATTTSPALVDRVFPTSQFSSLNWNPSP